MSVRPKYHFEDLLDCFSQDVGLYLFLTCLKKLSVSLSAVMFEDELKQDMMIDNVL